MKRLIPIVFLSILSVTSFSQSIADKLEGILNQIGNNIPADELFLHIDRNLYHGGDTIRFQTYIRDRQTGVFETPSISLYVLLLNSDHVTIDSARFRISYSTASGWLKVPEITPFGYYSILAFTSDQMNYDPKFAFNTPIRIDKIKPVRIDTEPKESAINSGVDLRFLPEGGTFVYGVKQRLAFNAINSNGRSIKVSGDIVNQDGKKIIDFRSGPYGPGVVELTPVQGETYYAKPVEAEFGNISWPLPEPEMQGASMRVNNTRSGSIDIIVRGRKTSGKQYFLTVTMNNILLFSRDIKLDTLFSARLKTDEIPAGTAYVTLYDNELNPISERLIFLNANKKMNVQIGVSNPTARPGSETELTINTTDEKGNNISSIVSVSVIDSSSGYQSNIPYPEIESSFLYDNEFYNNLPQSIKCLGLKNIDNNSIDQLLMTYGWRKHTLKETVLVTQEKRLDDYDHLKIRNPGKETRGRQNINIISPEGGGVISLGIDNNREAMLPYDSLEAFVRHVMILPDDDPSRNWNPVTIEFPENKVYTDKAKLIATDSCYWSPEIASVDNEMFLFNPDSAIMIETVTIKGQRKPPNVYVDKNAQQFKYTGAFTLYSKDFEFAQTFEDIVYKLHASYVNKPAQKIYLREIQYMPKRNERGEVISYRPALLVVDNVPIYDRTYSPIAQMRASEIASVTVIRGPQGFAIYGNEASNGVIIVTTKIGNRINGGIDPDNESCQNDTHLRQVRIFRTEVEYYIPTREEVESIPEFQFRPTLLWKSDVYLDGTGPVKIKYPNNRRTGSVMIFINGVSFSNLIGSNNYIYHIGQSW